MPNRMLTPDELETANALLRDIFYAVTRQDGTFDDTIEQFLDEKVESPAMAVVRKLATSNEQPSWEERIALTRWISFQELRTPLQRGGIEQIAGKIIKQTMLLMARAPGAIEEGLAKLKEQGKDYGVTAEDLRKSVEEDAFEIQVNPVLSLDVMMQAEEFVPILAEMQWTLVTARNGTALVTSDHPGSRFLLITHDFERERKWTELVSAGKEQEANALRGALPGSLPAMKAKMLDIEKTLSLKEGIIRSAPRFIFCPDEDPQYSELLALEPWTLRMKTG